MKSFIKKLPYSVRHPLEYIYGAIPVRFRYGKVFWDTYNFLQESQWWSRQKLEDYQMQRLSMLLLHVYENVPYYRRVFDERGIKPADIKTPKDLCKLPYLTKQDIHRNYNNLIAKNIPFRFKNHTSGSTGIHLTFEEEKRSGQIEEIFIDRALKSHASNLFFDKSIWLRSYAPKENEPIYRYVPHKKQLFLSAYHLSPKSISEYVRHINSYNAELLVGYPSSIYIFALLIKDTGLHLDNLKVAHTGSETLLDEWRDKIETILKIPVKDHYGMAEKVALFHQCSDSEYYHENLEYAVVEIINEKDGVGEVVGTNLWNYAMPFIRYRTGDTAVINKDACNCSCGRGLPLSVKKIEGRSDDILITPDKRYLPAVNFYTLFYKIGEVKMFKIIQHSLDKIEVMVVPSENFNDQHRLLLGKGLRERIGNEVAIEIRAVEMIERNIKTGKIRCVESYINRV